MLRTVLGNCLARQFPIHDSQDDDRNTRGREANLQVTGDLYGVQVCRASAPLAQRPHGRHPLVADATSRVGPPPPVVGQWPPARMHSCLIQTNPTWEQHRTKILFCSKFRFGMPSD